MKGKAMKVFVAGASGRVGNAVVSDLIKAGYEVVAGSRHPEGITGRSNRFLKAATPLYLLQGRAGKTYCRLTSMVLSK